MYKTLCRSFSLKNTYRVNSILYSLKQIPLLQMILPDQLYRVHGLKIFANVLSVLWEFISIFGAKLLYFLLMVVYAGTLYHKVPSDLVFLHILFFLSVIGAYSNTGMFHASRDKYYAMILLRMNAKEYTLVNYGYLLLKIILGFLPCTLLFGRIAGVPLWLCLLLPFCVVGMKLAFSAYFLWKYEKSGTVYDEDKLGKLLWSIMGILLLATYGLPAAGIVLPFTASAILFLAFLPVGAFSLHQLLTFRFYREINQELLAQITNQMDAPQNIAKEAVEKKISTDTSITSNRKGFEYLNDLFVKRHKKILWNSTIRITFISLLLIFGALLALHLMPESKAEINEMILTWLPYFTFILYIINRGQGFTQALFMNCDHSLLTYGFFKQPKFILKLFQIRLREIIKINVVPALVIGAGLSLLLYFSGGTANPFNYAVLFISILSMSVFFSIHYLTIYYLLQPYNAGTEIKSAMYQIIMAATYFVCYLFINVHLPILVFGTACILFCVLYSIVACILVYRYAPKTFRLRT